jgi:hypothetical protein
MADIRQTGKLILEKQFSMGSAYTLSFSNFKFQVATIYVQSVKAGHILSAFCQFEMLRTDDNALRVVYTFNPYRVFYPGSTQNHDSTKYFLDNKTNASPHSHPSKT